MTLLGKGVFADVIKLRVLMREGDLRHREGGRDWSHTVISQESLGPPELEEAGRIFP